MGGFVYENMKITTVFPNEIILFENDIKTDFSWIEGADRETVALFYGDFCSSCDIEIIEKINKSYDLNVILFNVTYSNNRAIPTKFNNALNYGYHVYSINMECLISSLGILFVPFVFVINSKREILAGNTATNSKEILETIKNSLKI